MPDGAENPPMKLLLHPPVEPERRARIEAAAGPARHEGRAPPPVAELPVIVLTPRTVMPNRPCRWRPPALPPAAPRLLVGRTTP